MKARAQVSPGRRHPRGCRAHLSLPFSSRKPHPGPPMPRTSWHATKSIYSPGRNNLPCPCWLLKVRARIQLSPWGLNPSGHCGGGTHMPWTTPRLSSILVVPTAPPEHPTPRILKAECPHPHRNCHSSVIPMDAAVCQLKKKINVYIHTHTILEELFQ